MGPSKLLLMLTLCAMAITYNVCADLPVYTIVDVGTLDSYHGDAYKVNDNSQVVGRSRSRTYRDHGFIWDEANGMTDVGNLGTEPCWARSINIAGVVVGKSLNAQGMWRAFLWDEQEGIRPIALPGTGQSIANDINDVGQVVGADGNDAFLWDLTTGAQYLGSLGGSVAAAEGINNYGQVVGRSYRPSGLLHAFLWDPDSGMLDLGTLGGSQSAANAINAGGQVVGYSQNASNNPRAFLWDSTNGMQDLGAMDDGRSWALDINDAGQIVGYAYSSGALCAVLWDPQEGLVDLNSLLPVDSGWTLSTARGINNQGEICGYGSLAGTSGLRAFLLRPEVVAVPEPTSIAYEGDLLISTEGQPTALTLLAASLRDEEGNVLPLDDAEVLFELTAEGIEPLQVPANSIQGIAECEAWLEPGIYTLVASCPAYDITASAVLEVYNPQGGCLTGGGWISLDDGTEKCGRKPKPNHNRGRHRRRRPLKGHFSINARYRDGVPVGRFIFRSSNRTVNVRSMSVDLLVVTRGTIAQCRGWAKVNGVPGYWYTAKFEDNGEPGKGNDAFEVSFWAPETTPEDAPELSFSGVLEGGNIQIHEDRGWYWRKPSFAPVAMDRTDVGADE